ncbi:hypothetical protein DZF95_03950 [Clavibacter michiganensis]|nr:hypothetical protein DZF95_03950 [Clavibacter michiganensis]
MHTIRTRRILIAKAGAAVAALTVGDVAQAAPNNHRNTAPAAIDDMTGQTTDPTLHQEAAIGSWSYDDSAPRSEGQM